MENVTCTSRQGMAKLLSRAQDGQDLSRQEIADLLGLTDPCEVEALYAAADRVRRKHVGDEIFLRGINEFSSHCRNNCLYCGLRRDNTGLERYRIPDDEIVDLARSMEREGCTTVVLQSGEDPFYTRDRMCAIISRIKGETSLAVTLSLGERTFEDYRAFRLSGADRYLLRHESASRPLYASLCPGRTLDDRIRCLAWLRDLGYEAGSGFMVGLPGQTVEDLADDVILIRELGADMVGIGPFIPHAQTPLGAHPAGDVNLVLKTVAVVRMVTRDANIPATTALGVLDKQSRKRAFHAGANVYMPVFTPHSYAKDYEIYPGKGLVSSDARKSLDAYREFFSSIGRPVGRGKGGRPGFQEKGTVCEKKTVN
ncbi:MAG TPA: [FeFe] hydrogenase H-cluster radical SAM maturase HydE [Deltaproteobacteria bacterium]|nr:[FeFe] hydrogenase H-cluster radical SAM maturase HydE [Deltaproteobacteria bacterium]